VGWSRAGIALMDFVALDVETANADLASICQIGLVEFRNGRIVQSWDWLVDPEDDFDGMNVSIHGIDEAAVRGQPTWPALHPQIRAIVDDRIVVSHTPFDRCSLQKVTEKYHLPPFKCTWLDSARVVRRTWPELSRSGYGLSCVAERLRITFHHHDAKEDARAAGEILIRAIEQSGVSIGDWLTKSLHLIGPTSLQRNGNPDGSLFGEVLVFTGALSINRREAADLAAKAGCNVVPSINKNVSLLVVGDQDIKRLAGHEKSSKQRKAEELIAAGQKIRILGESDFQRLLKLP
jgi:DNA polymerase-3 subunit epsilon